MSLQPEPIAQQLSRRFLAAFFAPEIIAWRGQLPLWRAFWGYGVLISSLLVGLYALADYQDRFAAREIILVCFSLYTAWVLVPIWRCAGNSRPFWGILARWLVVAWAGNALMLIPFLQLSLILR